MSEERRYKCPRCEQWFAPDKADEHQVGASHGFVVLPLDLRAALSEALIGWENTLLNGVATDVFEDGMAHIARLRACLE
jgi:hypothetical protein